MSSGVAITADPDGHLARKLWVEHRGAVQELGESVHAQEDVAVDHALQPPEGTRRPYSSLWYYRHGSNPHAPRSPLQHAMLRGDRVEDRGSWKPLVQVMFITAKGNWWTECSYGREVVRGGCQWMRTEQGDSQRTPATLLSLSSAVYEDLHQRVGRVPFLELLHLVRVELAQDVQVGRQLHLHRRR